MSAEAIAVLKDQRNLVIFVLSDAAPGKEKPFRDWFKGPFRSQIQKLPSVLRARVYEGDKVDITYGRFALPPKKFLAMIEISVGVPEESQTVLDQIASLHAGEGSATEPASWLYYPCSEKFGLERGDVPTTLTVHFANPVAGQEAEFREGFAVQLIRFAVYLPPLVSGQCFERTLFQKPGNLEPIYQTIGVYEQVGSSEDLVKSFKEPPSGLPKFDALDVTRFTESAYLPLN